MSSLGSPDLMANRLAIMVLKPGARQDWAMKPSLSSARQITSSPCFQSQLGMFRRYACRKREGLNQNEEDDWLYCGTAWAGWWSCSRHSSSSWRWPSWCWRRPRHQGLNSTEEIRQYQVTDYIDIKKHSKNVEHISKKWRDIDKFPCWRALDRHQPRGPWPSLSPRRSWESLGNT